jgi:hypothetical protein
MDTGLQCSNVFAIFSVPADLDNELRRWSRKGPAVFVSGLGGDTHASFQLLDVLQVCGLPHMPAPAQLERRELSTSEQRDDLPRCLADKRRDFRHVCEGVGSN